MSLKSFLGKAVQNVLGFRKPLLPLFLGPEFLDQPFGQSILLGIGEFRGLAESFSQQFGHFRAPYARLTSAGIG